MIVVIKGCIGICGAEETAALHEAELTALFPRRFRERFFALAAAEREQANDLPEGAVSLKTGLYPALYALGEAEDCGLTAEAGLLPVRQEVIEVCEAFALDPCLIPGSGYVRFAAEALPGETVIGRRTEGKARVLQTREGLRYLPKPKRG